MQKNNYNLGTRQSEDQMFQAGIAYVVIPKDVDRAKYISESLRTSTVSIYSEFNGYSNRVPVDVSVLNFISFPDDVDKFGSAVSFVIDPVRSRPIITGLFLKTDELSDLKEHQFKFRRNFNGNTVEISGSPDGKFINLNLNADTAGKIYIGVKSGNDAGEINFEVDGDFTLKSLGDTIIKQYNRVQIKTADINNEDDYSIIEQTKDENNFKSDVHNIDAGKVSINGGEENFVLGQTFKKLFDSFIDAVSQITTTTAIGQMPILNKEQVVEFKEQTKTILSQIGFIDK